MKYIKYNLTGIQLIAGQGAFEELKKEMKRMHVMKPLIVTDKGIVEAGIIEKAEVYLKNSQIPYAIYDEVFTDPTDELVEKGVEADFDKIEEDIIIRDRQDMEREIAPLKQAEDAVLVDSSDMTIEEVVDAIVAEFEKVK